MKALCIYCGSNPGRLNVYQETALELGTALAQRNITMIYGGGKVGLMGLTAEAALKAGGKVIGIIPEVLFEKELAHPGLTELKVVKSMHERKRTMAELADGFIALPGGIGTAEEIIEAFTWTQLGIHLKPCGILNIAGFYDGLITQLHRMAEDRFLLLEQVNQLIVEAKVENLLNRILVEKPAVMDKWLDREKVRI